MYKQGFRIEEDIGNNSFSYDIRKLENSKPQVYVTNLIQGTIDDIKIGNEIVFEEINSKREIKLFVGLKNFVKLNSTSKSVYIFDNHNHALFFRYQELFNGNISKGINLIHLDQHTDMNDNINVIAISSPVISSESKQSYLEHIFHFTNYKCNVGNFIQPAIKDGLISNIIQINTEYKLLNNETMKQGNYILDIDLDFRHPQMGIEQYTQTIQLTKNLIAQSSLVTIATSPYFLDQTLAIKILKDIFN